MFNLNPTGSGPASVKISFHINLIDQTQCVVCPYTSGAHAQGIQLQRGLAQLSQYVEESIQGRS